MSRWKALVMAVAVPVLVAAGTPPDAPVAEAAMRGDVEAVRALLRGGADANAAMGDGMTGLHWAARRGDAELAQVLIYAGANLSAGTRIGHYTPLHLASEESHAEVARVLLEAGADPNAAASTGGATPLHLAATTGDTEVIRALLDHGAEVNGREGAWGQTPLMFAAWKNRADAIRLLLSRGADPSLASRSIDVAEREKADEAAEDRLMEVLEQFRLEEGIDAPNWEPTPSQVQAAIEASREIQRKWPNVPQAEEDDEEAEEEEAESEAEAEPADADAGAEASEADENAAAPDSADGEPEAPRPPTYAQTVAGWGGLTPLLHAVRQGHEASALALLEGGADIDQVSGGDHTSPLLMATLNGQFDLALLLIERGADPNIASTAAVTPLYAVIEREWASMASYAHPIEHHKQQHTYMDVLKALLEAGADPNARINVHPWYTEFTFSLLQRALNFSGATPFWRAAFALDVNAMKLLVEHGADPNIPTMKPPERRRRMDADDEEKEEDKDHSGLPPVPVGGPAIYPIHAVTGVGYGLEAVGNAHHHVPEGWMAAVRYLVEELGADVNARDLNGYSPLHHAASRGDTEMIRYLVEQGADVTLVSRKGQTTADLANGPHQRVVPYPEAVSLLEELGSKNSHTCVSC